MSTEIVERFPLENVNHEQPLLYIINEVVKQLTKAFQAEKICNGLAIDGKVRNSSFYKTLLYSLLSDYLGVMNIEVDPNFRESTITLKNQTSENITMKIAVSKRGMINQYRKTERINAENSSKLISLFLVFNTAEDDSKIVDLYTLEAALSQSNAFLPKIIIIDVIN